MTYSYDNTFGWVLFLIGIVPSLIATKIITTPFKAFFRNLNKDGDAPIDLLGRKGLMLSSISGTKMGNAEVATLETHMSIYVKSLDGEPIQYREPILIIKQSADKNYYYVKPYTD